MTYTLISYAYISPQYTINIYNVDKYVTARCIHKHTIYIIYYAYTLHTLYYTIYTVYIGHIRYTNTVYV